MSNILLKKVIEEILIKYECLCVKHHSKESYQEILISRVSNLEVRNLFEINFHQLTSLHGQPNPMTGISNYHRSDDLRRVYS